MWIAVCKIVAATDVAEFVVDDRFELRGREVVGDAGRQEEDRTEDSVDAGLAECGCPDCCAKVAPAAIPVGEYVCEPIIHTTASAAGGQFAGSGCVGIVAVDGSAVCWICRCSRGNCGDYDGASCEVAACGDQEREGDQGI